MNAPIVMQQEETPEIVENEMPIKSHIEVTEDGEAVSDDKDTDDDEVEEIDEED